MEEKEIKKIIIKELKNIGMRIHLLGFKYWTTAIYIMIQEEEERIKMSYIYEAVARKHKTTATKVERALRSVRESLILKKYFNVDYKINNSAFLYLMTERIKEEIEELHAEQGKKSKNEEAQ